MGIKMGLRRIEVINQGIKACFDFDGEVTKVDESQPLVCCVGKVLALGSLLDKLT